VIHLSTFVGLTRPSDSGHSRDILDVHHSARAFFEKVRRAAQKMSFDGILWGKLRVMKIKISMILDIPDNCDEKFKMKHANNFTIYHMNEFMSLFKFSRSQNASTNQVRERI
jgi:hypothetical protein